MPILDPFEDVVQFHRPRGFESRFRARLSALTPIPGGANMIVPFDVEYYDSLGEFTNAAPNYFFRPVNPGYYHFDTTVIMPNTAAGTQATCLISLNGITDIIAYQGDDYPVGVPIRLSCGGDVYLVSTDVVNVVAFHDDMGGLNLVAGLTGCKFSGHRIG